MKFIEFQPNQPQSFIFNATEPFKAPDASFSLYPLPDGQLLYLLPAPAKRPAFAAVAAAGSKRRQAGAIPLNVAFREIVRFVVAELKDSGEQWSDQCRQDLVSTVMIAAQKANLLGVWEREEKAA